MIEIEHDDAILGFDRQAMSTHHEYNGIIHIFRRLCRTIAAHMPMNAIMATTNSRVASGIPGGATSEVLPPGAIDDP